MFDFKEYYNRNIGQIIYPYKSGGIYVNVNIIYKLYSIGC